MVARCEVTDLIEDQCAHCKGLPELDEEPSIGTLDDKHDEHPRAFPAAYDGWCALCKDPIVIGEWIKLVMSTGKYVHEECP